jgi:hypothetical protein
VNDRGDLERVGLKADVEIAEGRRVCCRGCGSTQEGQQGGGQQASQCYCPFGGLVMPFGSPY